MSTVVSKTTLSLYVDVMNIHKYLATKTIPFYDCKRSIVCLNAFLFMNIDIIKLQSYEKKKYLKNQICRLFFSLFTVDGLYFLFAGKGYMYGTLRCEQGHQTVVFAQHNTVDGSVICVQACI